MTTAAKTIDEPSQFVWEASHRIYYSTPNPVPIKEIVAALQGLDGLLKVLPKIASEITGVTIAETQFFVQSIESGSLQEDFFVRFFFGSKEDFDAFAEKMGKNKMVKGAAITALLAALVGYGAVKLTSSGSAPNITATNSVIIQGGAGTLNISAEAFQGALERAVGGDKKVVAENTIKLMAPVHAQPGSALEFVTPDNPAEKLTFPPEAIKEIPKRLELGANERIEEYKNTKLVIRAANLDSKKSGWAGRLALREDRLPIELDPAVSESDIFGRQEVMVDAALVFKEKGQSRELKPARIYVRKVIGAVPSTR